MHYAEFAEDEVSWKLLSCLVGTMLMSKKSAALLAAIKEYDANKWKVIGQKVGKPAKVRVDGCCILSFVCKRPILTCTRHASSTQKRILAASTERHVMITVCVFPGLVRWGALYDTSFPISIEHRMRKTAVGIRSSFLVFPDVVLGSGVHKELVAFFPQKDAWEFRRS
jgi:hypothetical protein